MTQGPYIIIPPGGPAGPFYGLMNAQGNIVAIQIAGEENAKFLASAWEMWQQLVALWNKECVRDVLDYDELVAFEKLMIGDD